MRSWRDAASRTLKKPASGSSSGTTGQTLYFRPHCGGKNCKKRVMRPEIPRLERTFINLQLFPHNSLLPARRRISFQKGKKWSLGRWTHGWTQDPGPARNGRKVELSNCLGTETLVGRKQSKLFRETFLYLRYKSELFPLKFRIPQFIRIK